MINITWINARFLTQEKSGVQQFAIELSKKLLKINPYIKFIAPKNTIDKALCNELNVQYYGNKTGTSWEQFELPIFLKKQGNPTLLNLCNSAPLNYKNSIVTLHDLAFLENPNWFSFFFRKWYKFMIPKIAKNAKHILTVSQFSKSEIAKKLSIEENEISIIYNGLNSELLNYTPKKSKFKTDKKIILTVGSINPRKNIKPLIEGYSNLNLSNYELLVVGGKSSNFKKESFSLKNDSVKFLGHLTDNELWDLYNEADIFILPSLYEGFGIPVLEALHFNCTILVNDLEIFKELYTTFTLNYTKGNRSKHYKESLSTLINNIGVKENHKDMIPSIFSYSKSAEKVNKIISAKSNS